MLKFYIIRILQQNIIFNKNVVHIALKGLKI